MMEMFGPRAGPLDTILGGRVLKKKALIGLHSLERNGVDTFTEIHTQYLYSNFQIDFDFLRFFFDCAGIILQRSIFKVLAFLTRFLQRY